MRIKVLVLVASLAFAPLAATPTRVHAQQAEDATVELTLEEAVALALRDNRELRSVRLWRAVDRFDLFLAHRRYWPQGGVAVSAIRRKATGQATTSLAVVSPYASWTSPIGTEVTANWSRERDWTGGGGRYNRSSVSVRQPLLRGAGLDVNMAPLQRARINEELSRLAEEEAVAGLIDQVTLGYRNLIQMQEQLELAKLALERSRTLLDTNNALIEAGRMAAADIVQTHAEVANQEVALLEAERALTNARTALSALLSLAPDTALRAVGKVAVEEVVIAPEEAVEMALQRRRDLKTLSLGLELAEIGERLARNERLWDVAVVADMDRSSGPFEGRDLTARSIGLQINVPLGDFTGRRSVMSAQASRHTAQLRMDSERDRIEQQVRDAVAEVASRWRQLQTSLRARALAAQSLELHSARLQAGRATNFEVLGLQAALRSADAQALSARIAYANALTALDQQMGRTLEVWQISFND